MGSRLQAARRVRETTGRTSFSGQRGAGRVRAGPAERPCQVCGLGGSWRAQAGEPVGSRLQAARRVRETTGGKACVCGGVHGRCAWGGRTVPVGVPWAVCAGLVGRGVREREGRWAVGCRPQGV